MMESKKLITLIDKLKKYGFVPIKIKYSCDFGMMLLERNESIDKCAISKLEKNEINTDWREYRDKVVSYLSAGGVNDGV